MKVTAIIVLLGLALVEARAEDLSKIPELKSRDAVIRKGPIQYPYEAKRQGLIGRGIAVVSVDSKTGTVTAVTMGKSTGHAILDRAVIKGLRQSRYKPGTISRVKIPVTFTMDGGPIYETVDVKKQSMDDVLAAYLGKGTVLKGPIPAYPRFPAWIDKNGKGVYEIHADAQGKVTQVKVFKPSGDATFDREAVKTLGKWRLRPRGRDLILELPLRFTLTPTNYSVDVGR